MEGRKLLKSESNMAVIDSALKNSMIPCFRKLSIQFPLVTRFTYEIWGKLTGDCPQSAAIEILDRRKRRGRWRKSSRNE